MSSVLKYVIRVCRLAGVLLNRILNMVFLRALFISLMFIMALNPAQADNDKQHFYRNFWNPTFNIQRLNYCSLDGRACGLTLAHRYCNIMGYQEASDAIIDYNVGVTHYLLTHARCTGWQCNGFMLITCKNKFHHQPAKDYAYREQRFMFPRFSHYRIDWCYDNGKGCGQRVAYSFCRRMGYRHAKHYKKEMHVAATKALGNQRLCFGQACNGFIEITCYR